MNIRDRGPLTMIRQWWKRHFASAGRPDGPGDSDPFERCPRCGQAFDPRDLEQVLPHFEHQLAAGAPRPETLVRHEDRPSHPENVVPFRRGRLGVGSARRDQRPSSPRTAEADHAKLKSDA
jgi:hypothetical protein